MDSRAEKLKEYKLDLGCTLVFWIRTIKDANLLLSSMKYHEKPKKYIGRAKYIKRMLRRK